MFAPVPSLSFGAPGAIVLAPGDTRSTVLIPERCDGRCMGLDGRDGPNLACANCGQAVATRIDDCSYWQSTRLAPNAVRRVPGDGPTPRPVEWAVLAEERESTPPVEPSGHWSPRWEAAVGSALAHLLVASAGAPVTLPGGLVTSAFGRALDALLPRELPTKGLALAGPGLPPPDPAPDIALVPRHPQTGRAWQPPGTAVAVPLAADVWLHLAFHDERSAVPVTGGTPEGVLRDDPLPMHPPHLFRPDSAVFLHTLARLPAVRQPWLRGVHDRVRAEPYARPFSFG
ncbi:hypothetical protein [Kitasatospora paranensis]|uniref:Uncharacterized protein n=1 Tax=Kitasatospora paranensis TaxID=258053 RepID=A0ABW2FYH2_9ACTN